MKWVSIILMKCFITGRMAGLQKFYNDCAVIGSKHLYSLPPAAGKKAPRSVETNPYLRRI